MVTSSMPPPPPPFVARRAFRDLDAPIAGGVAGGLARHLGVPVLWVRLAFVVTALLGGFGIMVYAGLWIFLPAERDLSVQAPGLDSATRSDIAASGVQTINVLTALPPVANPTVIDGLTQPGASCGDDTTPRSLLIAVRGRGNAVAMAGLVLTGLGLFAFRNGSLQAAGDIVIAGLLGVLGLVMVGGPWALRLIDDLGAERAERVRSQERDLRQ